MNNYNVKVDNQNNKTKFDTKNFLKVKQLSTTVQKYNVQVNNQIHKIKVDSLFPTRFANTILSQLPRTCFAVLVMTERTWYALDFLNLVWLKWILKELPSGGEFSV